MIKKRYEKQSGFTFLEIVLAISILAIIMTITQSILVQMIRGKKFLDETRDVELVLNNITNRLNKELQLAQDTPLPNETKCNNETIVAGQNNICFCGESSKHKEFRHDKISFMSTKAAQYLRGKYIAKSKRVTDLVMITYRVEKGKREAGESLSNEHYWLIRDEVPVINGKIQEDYKMTFPIYKDISEFKVRYFNADEDKWQDTWSGEEEEDTMFPSLIEFTIKIKNNHDRIFSSNSTVLMLSSTKQD